MTGQNGRGRKFTIQLPTDLDQRLAEMAAEAGMSKSRLAAHLLTELLPTVKSVRTRLQITRVPSGPDR